MKYVRSVTHLKSIIVALLIVVGVAALQAQSTFTYPPAGTVAPANNAPAPINVSNTAQAKTGALFLNTNTSNPYSVGLKVFGQTLLYPNFAGDIALQVGTTTGGLSGKVQIIDGSQGAGKILTSDAQGIASWTATSSLGIGNGSAPSVSGWVTVNHVYYSACRLASTPCDGPLAKFTRYVSFYSEPYLTKTATGYSTLLNSPVHQADGRITLTLPAACSGATNLNFEYTVNPDTPYLATLRSVRTTGTLAPYIVDEVIPTPVAINQTGSGSFRIRVVEPTANTVTFAVGGNTESSSLTLKLVSCK